MTSLLTLRRARSWQRFQRNRPSLAALVALGIVAVVAASANLLAPYDPFKTGLTRGLEPPSPSFPMGTDQIGRDILSQVIFGSRVAIFIGAVSTLIAFVIGLVLGLAAGFIGGRLDNALMAIADFVLSIPSFVLIIVLVILYGSTIPRLALVIGIVSWPTLARIARAEVLSLKQREFVVAARALGFGRYHIMVSEILPNLLPALTVPAVLQVANAILIEAGLSFLGLTDPNAMSWGTILYLARSAFYAGAWWPIVFPGIVIVAAVLSVNLVGDGLNDALNPKERAP